MPSDESKDSDLARYARQMRLPHFGSEAQRRLLAARALICGCGALGSVIAETLARSGVGHLRIVDRDFVELTNLQRQVLFDEQDAAAAIPKAIAAAEKLRRINSNIEIEPIVADFDSGNARSLAKDVDVIVDGTDNFETRFLINDLALEQNIPWVYGGSIVAEGQSMTILPGETPCLRCLMSEPPGPGETPTCDTVGVLGPIVGVIASIESAEALKILSGNRQAINRSLTVIDLWHNRFRHIQLDSLQQAGANCDACQRRAFPWLAGERSTQTAVLCGRDSVQVSGPRGGRLALDDLRKRLEASGKVTANPHLLRLAVDDYLITIFADGRAIIGGTSDPTVARALYAKYIGV